MSFAVFLQVFVNILFFIGFFVIFARLRRPAKDDPRLSRGLQLLSSKIAILEDLSDRTEAQVQQMLQLLDHKTKEVQAKITQANEQTSAIQVSMSKSLEVAKIFQDKIPHDEIIERQNSMKYIQAARLAHSGASPEEIARAVDLPIGEIEFIAKVNRESLTFREEDLPEWARDPNAIVAAPTPLAAQPVPTYTLPVAAPTAEVAAPPVAPVDDFARLGEEFRRAVLTTSQQNAELEAARAMAARLASEPLPTPQSAVRKVEFPRIDAVLGARSSATTPVDWRP